MKKTNEFTPHQSALDAIAESDHHTPFDVLGQHLYASKASHTIVIRAFVPDASSIKIIPKNAAKTKAIEMVRIHPSGIFQAVFPRKKTFFPYLYEITRNDFTWQTEDPYIYGPFLTDFDLHLFYEGNHLSIYKRLGSHKMILNGIEGAFFAVWAPNARRVSVVGDFNEWDGRRHVMRVRPGGVWEIFIPRMKEGDIYKFEIKDNNGLPHLKSDPYGFLSELRPKNASVIYDLEGYEWDDEEWIINRKIGKSWQKPMNIYEVHLGSWRKDKGFIPKEGEEDNNFLSYRELAHQLASYILEMGYTHIELLPIAEHPLDASWGYQVISFYAPTSRFGLPKDFMYFVDYMHQKGIGVILDWVPAHFPKDSHGLSYFDGTYLYEHADPRKGEHKDWGTKVFNFGRNEVRNFLIANALYWLEYYHIDGLRVDAVASMLYLDYSREGGDWLPNQYGGRENIEAITFIQQFNKIVYQEYPGVITIAEESTSWAGVSKPTYLGGLGFGYKWNMGWMNDILDYMQADPIYRKFKHGILAFSLVYTHSENFILPLSHDEVVHGKRSLLNKMPGDQWKQFANLRLLYAYMMGHPGKKLLFMGGEFGQYIEWALNRELDWFLLEFECHRKLKDYVRDLNLFYLNEPSLWELDTSPEGFSWIDFLDNANTVILFIRYASNKRDHTIFACNFTPLPRIGYCFGVPTDREYKEVFNSDRHEYLGSGIVNLGNIKPKEGIWHHLPYYIQINLPPLAVTILKPVD